MIHVFIESFHIKKDTRKGIFGAHHEMQGDGLLRVEAEAHAGRQQSALLHLSYTVLLLEQEKGCSRVALDVEGIPGALP